ncbi:MAG: histidine kinase [Saprospiraceae bacterium]|nr:histidine kinase [Saprospiraceae bacterium]
MKSTTCFKDAIGFDDRLMIVVGIPIAGVIVSLVLFGQDYLDRDWIKIGYCLPISMVYTSLFWLAMRRVYYMAWQRFPALDQIKHRLLWSFAGFLVTYVIVNFGLDFLFRRLFPAQQQDLNIVVEFVVSMVLSALVVAIYEACSFYTQLTAAIREKAELERNYVSSQLEGLRNQVNPHFLFNSLNTLVYLIPESPDKAVSFVQKMSKVYRYVLESRDADVIPLEEEMEFLNAYIFLLKERFGDNLIVQLPGTTTSTPIGIVPLTLQMLFENAIKHNIISSEKPLTIEVFVENNRLIVRNNLQRKNQVMDSTGVGLQNIKDRYKMVVDQPVEVIISQQYFTVVLPTIGSPNNKI